MKPGPFVYHDPTTVDEVVGLLAANEETKLLAGGQSLMPMLNMRFVLPDHLIDLNRVSGLDGVEDTGSALRIGGMTRQTDLVASGDIKSKAPIMHEALQWVGHFQTRNRGTIGGSHCHLDPSAELPVVSLLYDAEITVQGPNGARQIGIGEWPLAYMTPSLAPDELMTSVTLPYWPDANGYAFEEFARRHGDFAIVAVGCLMAIEGGTIKRAALALGGAQQVPYRLGDAEQALAGQPATTETFKAAAEIAGQQEAISDAYIEAGYRQRLARVLTERALNKAAKRAAGE